MHQLHRKGRKNKTPYQSDIDPNDLNTCRTPLYCDCGRKDGAQEAKRKWRRGICQCRWQSLNHKGDVVMCMMQRPQKVFLFRFGREGENRNKKRCKIKVLQRSCIFWVLEAEAGGFEPPVRLPVRQFSKLVVSATHPHFLPSTKGHALFWRCKGTISFWIRKSPAIIVRFWGDRGVLGFGKLLLGD